MRTITISSLTWVAILALVVGCNEAEHQANGAGQTHRPTGSSATRPANPAPAAPRQGKVLETMNSGGYTYVWADVAGQADWFAGPETQVAVGDTVVLPAQAMAMRDFESQTLRRTFDLIYFVGAIGKAGGTAAPADTVEAHATTPAAAPEAAPEVDPAGIQKAAGGQSVAEVFQAGAAAAGRDVVLRGKVVKYNAGILGKNWLHVRDGTGEAGTNDITVTTQDTVKVGDTVLVKGKIAADRDFGHGYQYPLMIEDATVVVE